MADFPLKTFHRRILGSIGALMCAMGLWWTVKNGFSDYSKHLNTSSLTIMTNVTRADAEYNDLPKKWDIGPLDTVLMNVENTDRYPLYLETEDDDWNRSLPSGGGLIRLGMDQEIYSISMFHQLRCLGMIRMGIVEQMQTDQKAMPGALTQHCMNFLRQMVLCRADLRLESCRNPQGPRISVSDVTHTCNDWSTIYAAAEENFEKFMNRKQ